MIDQVKLFRIFICLIDYLFDWTKNETVRRHPFFQYVNLCLHVCPSIYVTSRTLTLCSFPQFAQKNHIETQKAIEILIQFVTPQLATTIPRFVHFDADNFYFGLVFHFCCFLFPHSKGHFLITFVRKKCQNAKIHPKLRTKLIVFCCEQLVNACEVR